MKKREQRVSEECFAIVLRCNVRNAFTSSENPVFERQWLRTANEKRIINKTKHENETANRLL